MEETEIIAKRCVVKNREIYLHLNDGRVFRFSAAQFPLLAKAKLGHFKKRCSRMLFGLGERDRLGRTRRRLADETFYGCVFI